MPSRKKSESSSLRRLSSIASLQTFNPFRRRSHNNTDITASASNVSLTSSINASPAQPQKQFSSSEIFSDHDNTHTALSSPPSHSQIPARKSSYICISDDPIGGMPRSRTFSNLPLPTRAKKSREPLNQSRPHARLPSNLLPNTRLPSPKFSTRKHSITHLQPVDNNAACARQKFDHSDTEPLLQDHLNRSSSIHRTTAFKENISLSPIKPLPGIDYPYGDAVFRFSPPVQNNSRAAPLAWNSQQAMSSPALPSTSNASSFQPPGPPDTAYRRMKNKIRLGEKDFQSSPGYQSNRRRPPTPGQPVQRWSSQPVLTNRTNLRSSHGEIKQARLMSARQAPTPPPPKTPLSTEDLNLARLRSSTVGHLSLVSEQSSDRGTDSISTGPRTETTTTPNLDTITNAEPFDYWTGRFSSLIDRYRNQELLASINIGSPIVSSLDWKTKSETDRIHSAEANSARVRRAVEHMYSQCATEPARQSFLRWQRQLGIALDLPELAKPKGERNCALEMSLKEMADIPTPVGSGRKVSIMDRLLGISRAKRVQ